MIQITNNGETRARVFGPTGAVIVIEPSETVDVSFSEDELEIEQGGNVSFKQKAAKANKKPQGE